MVDVARVNLYGQPIGSVRWDQRYEVAQFEYDPDFVRQGIEPSPLMMPVREGRVYSFGELDKTTFNGLPGMLADSLPDTYGRTLFQKWLALTGRTSGNAIETLCFLGKRCMGALEFEPAIDAVDTDIRIEVDSLVDVAREALADKSSFNVNIGSDKKAAIAEILRLGTSAGGQRAKAIIAYNKSTGEIRSGQVEAPDGFDYYIIKLDGVSATAGFRETENFGRLEYSFSRLVRECGIDTFLDKAVRPDKRCEGAHADALRYRALRLPTPQGLLLRTGVCRNARSAAYLQGGAGDVPQNGVQCRGA